MNDNAVFRNVSDQKKSEKWRILSHAAKERQTKKQRAYNWIAPRALNWCGFPSLLLSLCLSLSCKTVINTKLNIIYLFLSVSIDVRRARTSADEIKTAWMHTIWIKYIEKLIAMQQQQNHCIERRKTNTKKNSNNENLFCVFYLSFFIYFFWFGQRKKNNQKNNWIRCMIFFTHFTNNILLSLLL